MKKGKAFLVVGHKKWGKSFTLRALTDDKRGWVTIAGQWFFLRRMSNDDVEDSYLKFVRKLDPVNKPYVLAAFCPTFETGRAEEILQILSRNYDIFVFVLHDAFDETRTITDTEIAALRRFGQIELFDGHAEDSERAAKLRSFIEEHVLEPSMA